MIADWQFPTIEFQVSHLLMGAFEKFCDLIKVTELICSQSGIETQNSLAFTSALSHHGRESDGPRRDLSGVFFGKR